MTLVRVGDLVTFTARVTAVEPYDHGQQIQAKILPNGETLGWCIPKENAFEIKELTLRVGDQVIITPNRPVDERYDVLFLTEHQATIRKVGNWNAEIQPLSALRRVS